MYDVLWCTIEIHYTQRGIIRIYFKSKLCILILPKRDLRGVNDWEEYEESKDIHCQVNHKPNLE